tara:strand:+ start:76 stop:345 length:270 start_codon:yes stop_codon:yes gene_type:complete
MSRYTYGELIFVVDNASSRLYNKKQLIFKGNSYIGLKLMIEHSKNNPEVIDMFKAQLELREKPRFQNTGQSEITETREQYIERLKKEVK